ncbi:hypothetical protein [Faecalibacterium sp. An121]|uniref:hypothetical protein n=1 Tax=Faecalibacterium sp. An121 TaxID=1965550 RepID=UPI00117B2AED|nr:hypothetical protein [Faecalibacterium sp. An121]
MKKIAMICAERLWDCAGSPGIRAKMYPSPVPLGYNIPLFAPDCKSFLKKKRVETASKRIFVKAHKYTGRFLQQMPNLSSLERSPAGRVALYNPVGVCYHYKVYQNFACPVPGGRQR